MLLCWASRPSTTRKRVVDSDSWSCRRSARYSKAELKSLHLWRYSQDCTPDSQPKKIPENGLKVRSGRRKPTFMNLFTSLNNPRRYAPRKEDAVRILKPVQINTLVNEYRKHGRATCPECGTALRVITTPQFLTDGRVSASTFSVVCKSCGLSGATEARELPRSA